MKRTPTFIALVAFLLMVGLLAMPFGAKAGLTDASIGAEQQQLLNGANRAYSTELQTAFFTNFGLATPETLPNVAGFADKVVAADFSADDTMIYAFNETDGTFVTIDPTSGAQTEIAASLPISGTWTGLATDTTDGTVYASSADCTADSSTLWTVNPLTGEATEVGAISTTQCIQALAVDVNGQLWGVDSELDQLFTIDSATGAGTAVGATGVDAFFSVGLEVDYTTDILYMTTIDLDAFESRLYTLDRGTGTATQVGGALGSTDPTGLTELGWLAISGQLPPTCGSGLPVGIGDNSTINNTASVTDTRYLIDLNVYVDASHTFVGDLIFDLEHNGTTVSLLNQPNSGAGDCVGDNLDMTFDDGAPTAAQTSCLNADPAYNGPYQPAGSLSDFDMQVYDGDWTLTIQDANSNGQSGTLNDWCLEPTLADPAIVLDKTVSTDGSCGTESEINIFADTDVTYCYTVTNMGNITLTNQTLVDSVLGTVVSDTISLGIGETRVVTQTQTINATTTNDATWTAENPSGPSATASASATVTVIPNNCSAPDLAIPDAISAGITDTITLADTGVITDINVSVMTEHPWVGDLSYTLTHMETGVSVTVIDRPGVPADANGCSGDDINATLDDEATDPVEDECAAGTPTINGTFTPNNPLSAFDLAGVPVAGTWQLNVSDAASGQTGSLTQWCVDAVTGEPEITIEPTDFLSMTQFQNTVISETLTISNTGNAILNWDVEETLADCAAPSDLPWVSVDPISGTTAISASSALSVTFDTTGLAFGTYTANLCVNSNDSDEGLLVVPVSLTVDGTPDISVSPTTLISLQNPDQMVTDTFTISNVGEGNLDWTLVEDGASSGCAAPSDISWFSITPDVGTTVPLTDTETIATFDSTGLAAGNYSAILCVESNDPDESPLLVDVILVVEEPVTTAVDLAALTTSNQNHPWLPLGLLAAGVAFAVGGYVVRRRTQIM